MISGDFNQKGELVFAVDLVAADQTDYRIKAIFDTGFTGWLIVHNQDAIALGWKRYSEPKTVQTASGITTLNVYEGIVLLDEEEFTIPVFGGSRVKDILLGVRWLRFKRLIADYSGGVLTLD
ncbi:MULTISPECIES: aspartyl protease [Planktothricoides]|uniref:Aspartyl protease n=2 Tax=Planktothricoides raciborskii TaxID=132608 RepID=A0AAU8JIT5_9CYAN|nr:MULTISPECIES: aspartyl protease [Planktothricoides]KOR36908.1 aspartyl protease [Planktothricoides sp. SR001]MBD2546210.1 aspartyl protease [Planktothricoides raciborskii FACHB-1370]MBD2584483.1 aspartyl protease [Planktothricoides raciborskii FACHB-1261]